MTALVLIAVVSIFGVAISVVSIFSCHPIRAFWAANLWSTNCIDLVVFWYSNACFNIATDTAVVVLPLYVLKDLRTVSRRQRLAVNAIFLVGAV